MDGFDRFLYDLKRDLRKRQQAQQKRDEEIERWAREQMRKQGVRP